MVAGAIYFDLCDGTSLSVERIRDLPRKSDRRCRFHLLATSYRLHLSVHISERSHGPAFCSRSHVDLRGRIPHDATTSSRTGPSKLEDLIANVFETTLFDQSETND